MLGPVYTEEPECICHQCSGDSPSCKYHYPYGKDGGFYETGPPIVSLTIDSGTLKTWIN